MRISDWSSDVCSSDLVAAARGPGDFGHVAESGRDLAPPDYKSRRHEGIELIELGGVSGMDDHLAGIVPPFVATAVASLAGDGRRAEHRRHPVCPARPERIAH